MGYPKAAWSHRGNLSEISGVGEMKSTQRPWIILVIQSCTTSFLSQPQGCFFWSKQPSPFFYLLSLLKSHLNEISKNDPFYKSLLKDILLLNSNSLLLPPLHANKGRSLGPDIMRLCLLVPIT